MQKKKFPGPVQQWGVTVKKWVLFISCIAQTY